MTAGQPGRRCSVTVLSTKMAGAGVSLTRGACDDEDSSDGQDGLVEGQFDLGGNDRRDGFLRGSGADQHGVRLGRPHRGAPTRAVASARRYQRTSNRWGGSSGSRHCRSPGTEDLKRPTCGQGGERVGEGQGLRPDRLADNYAQEG